MSHKFNSAEAYADMRSLGDKVFRMDIIGLGDVQEALDALSGLRGVDVPSAKSFLDWARREHLVEGVIGERGRYRWAASTEDEAVEIGRQIAQEGQERVSIPDTDPNHPMILQESEEAEDEPLKAFYPDGALKVDFYLKAKRISRRRKRMIKRGIESNPAFGRITVHCGAEADDMVVTER